MTICLPFEILTAIFEEVDDVQDLHHVRIASRTLCAAATTIAFRVLSVTNTAGSVQNIGRLFDVPDIAAHIKEVAYCYTFPDGLNSQELRRGESSSPLSHKRSYDLSLYLPWWVTSVRTSAIPELASLFSRIHQLPQLETIDLKFSPVDRYGLELDGDGRFSLQASILDALAASFSICAPSKLIALSLHNLRASDHSPLDSPPFQTVLKSLRCLQLSVLFVRTLNPHTAFTRWSHFWGNVFLCTVLSPTQHSLTELTLHNNTFLGASSGLSLSGLRFPHLCALSLRKLVFEPSVGVEPFILRHTATLARLELVACRLLDDDDRFPSPSLSPSTPPSTTFTRNEEFSLSHTHWARIWDCFAAELTALVSLDVYEHDNDRPYSGTEWLYVRPGLGLSYLEFYKAPFHAVDAAALQRFRTTVAARSKEIHGEF